MGYIIQFFSVLCVNVILLCTIKGDGLYILLALINSTITTIELFSHKNRPFTLHKMVNLFILFFFVIANAIQYTNNSLVSSVSIVLTDDDYVQFQIIVLFIIVLFNLFYFLFEQKNKQVIIKDMKDSLCGKGLKLIIVSMIAFSILIFHYRNNLVNLFFMGIAGDEFGSGFDMENGAASSLLFGKFVRCIPFACYMVSANYQLNKKVKLILLLIMLFAVFPSGIARNAVAMYWLPVLLFELRIFHRQNAFVFMMIIGLLLVFPFLNIFRYWGGELNFEYSLDFLDSMHFDASQEFMIILKKEIVTWGYQLLGVLLFFVPRSIWPGKPIGSGAFIAQKGDDFGNISMPFWAEGYINFGYIGIFVFITLLSWICSKIDSTYWRDNNRIKRITPYYYTLIGASIFILRGDLLSSTAYTVSTLLTIFFVTVITKKGV